MYQLIKSSTENGLNPEEFMSILDENEDCHLDEQEMLDFLEKWSKRKGTNLSEETKRFEKRAFAFIDDDNDGILLGREILPAQETAKKYAYLGSYAESVFGYFWSMISL